MQESQNQVNYQAFIIWCLRKGIQRKKTSKSQPQRSNTLESSSTRSTRTILTSRQRLLLLSTPHHQWLDEQPSSPSLPSGFKDDRQAALRSAARGARRAKRGDKKKATRKRRQGGIRVSAVLRARSRRVAGDLSPWRREHRGACMVVDYGSSNLEELHSTLF